MQALKHISEVFIAKSCVFNCKATGMGFCLQAKIVLGQLEAQRSNKLIIIITTRQLLLIHSIYKLRFPQMKARIPERTFVGALNKILYSFAIVTRRQHDNPLRFKHFVIFKEQRNNEIHLSVFF